MRPVDVSEFSFGYAVTEALVQGAPYGLTAAPLFPSLQQEGNPGGGYDLKLSFSGFVLFLQFKLTDRMERRTAKETKKGLFEPPFFRMHLRSSHKSDQHAMLLGLEQSGEAVFYAAPRFNTAAELNSHYLNHSVLPNCVFIRPSSIGPLLDDKEHWVAFKQGASSGYFCSTPKKLARNALLTGERVLKVMSAEAKTQKTTPESLRDTAMRMETAIARGFLERGRARRTRAAAQEYEREVARLLDDVRRVRETRRPDEQVAYLSRTFFGCEAIRIEQAKEATAQHGGPEPGTA